MDEKHLEIYGRLFAVAAISEATIKNNPMPHLRKAAQRIAELEDAIRETRDILDGSAEMRASRPHSTVEYEDAQDTAFNRNSRALKVLDRITKG